MDVLYRYSIACGNVFVSACHLVMVWRSFSAHRYGMVYRNIDRSEETTQKKKMLTTKQWQHHSKSK